MPSKLPATCHPEKLRKSADGLCRTCWERRKYATDATWRESRKLRSRSYRKARYDEEVGDLPTFACAYCGGEHTPKTRHQQNRFCSRNCQDAHNKMLRRVGRAESGGYTRQEVFERDGWVCALCRRKIKKSARSPDPLSASVDHIIPLSLGGSDSLSNVQSAHLSCNVAKGTRASGEQLRLVG